MDHSAAPLLDALVDYHARTGTGLPPPGHRQGRGADPRTRAALGEDAFRSDVLATAGLDDRTSSHGYLSRAEELMANAVGAEQAFFLFYLRQFPVGQRRHAGRGRRQGDLLISRDAHKSVVSRPGLFRAQPQWIRLRYDTRLHVAHPPSPEQVEQAWQKHPDAAGALIVSPTPYGTCADISCCPATRSSSRRKPSRPTRRPDVSARSRSPRTRPAYRSSFPGSASPPSSLTTCAAASARACNSPPPPISPSTRSGSSAGIDRDIRHQDRPGALVLQPGRARHLRTELGLPASGRRKRVVCDGSCARRACPHPNAVPEQGLAASTPPAWVRLACPVVRCRAGGAARGAARSRH